MQSLLVGLETNCDGLAFVGVSSNRSRAFLLHVLQVIGDATPEASKLMKREGVRSVPSFHYFVGGEKVDVVNGANAEAIESTITKHVSPA